jgi:branched-chain amino acid transport system substrate-binding protein
MEHRMSSRFRIFWLATASAVCLGTPAVAQDTVKIGELNSYKSQPAFLEPYKRGWELAVEEINAKGGVLGKKLEVISRDDGANPGDAVRVANELVTREGATLSPAPSCRTSVSR